MIENIFNALEISNFSKYAICVIFIIWVAVEVILYRYIFIP